eukprot:gb/GECG01003559.1/.p1 GENE.gb/GECG01003559.1/~~gb/GECG01003559.1/.p1  ORF type:complete len:333 (+),score=15.91 gb/GECG01003559.1/:1-999(+)
MVVWKKALSKASGNVAAALNPFPHALRGDSNRAGKIVAARVLLILVAVSLGIAVIAEISQTDGCAYQYPYPLIKKTSTTGITAGSFFSDLDRPWKWSSMTRMVCWRGHVFSSSSCPLRGYHVEANQGTGNESTSNVPMIFWNARNIDDGSLDVFEHHNNSGVSAEVCDPPLYGESSMTKIDHAVEDGCGLEGWRFDTETKFLWAYCMYSILYVIVLAFLEIGVLAGLDEDEEPGVLLSGVKQDKPASVPHLVKVMRFLCYTSWLAFPNTFERIQVGDCPTFFENFYQVQWYVLYCIDCSSNRMICACKNYAHKGMIILRNGITGYLTYHMLQ